ncbi:hypothetical protein [Pontibacter burrus]|uniref:Uncharacterized protein n=1 Tax=Pontibacter burrus TaxID=2704466 RepID=A0A6B3LM70_9BACT|nr:hypothetical protein [Pontibacter burrus]NEM96165.1 hypothetical protein [Pontibacter burrus]
MAQEQFTRTNAQGEAKHYTAQFGKDEQGNWLPIQLIPQEADSFSGQQRKLTFKSLHVESDREGNITIRTEFYDDQFTPTGLLSPSFSRVISENTRGDEAQFFFDQLRSQLEKNILNILAAGGAYEGSGFLGHPHNRFFDAQGNRNALEDVNALPTYDYHGTTENPADL